MFLPGIASSIISLMNRGVSIVIITVKTFPMATMPIKGLCFFR